MVQLSNVVHLITRFRGRLSPSQTVADIYGALQPTPAVSGSPLEPALAYIEKLEDFDRGWYASGVGVLGPDTADIIVAIRSALVENNQVSLFTGAGIVSDSDPKKEWNELEQKMAAAMSLFSRTAI